MRRWIWPIVVLLVGTGGIWKYGDLRLKSRTTAFEQIRVEKELYERLQVLQKETSLELPRYIVLRDLHFSNTLDYQVQNEYGILKAKLSSLIAEYNRLEQTLSKLEDRPPRWFVLAVPPLSPTNVRFGTSPDGSVRIEWDSQSEPLEDAVDEEMKVILQK